MCTSNLITLFSINKAHNFLIESLSLLTVFLNGKSVLYSKLAYTLRTLWIQNRTVSYRSAFGYWRQFLKTRTSDESSSASGYAGGPTIFLGADWERGNREKFLPPRIFRSLVQARGSLTSGKSRSNFRPWRYHSSDILCCYEFQPTYHKSNLRRWRMCSVRYWLGPQYLYKGNHRQKEAKQALLAIDRTWKSARVSISNLLRKDTRKH